MKDKVKRFLIDKKELLVFIAVVVVVFATVITIASLALTDAPVVNDDPVVNPDDGNHTVTPPSDNDDKHVTPNPEEEPKFTLPVSGEYEIVRTFFDISLSDEELVSAIIVNGNYMIESKGLSYAKPDNSEFTVNSIYSGVVLSVEDDELNGTTVTIKHSNSVVSVYSSLTDVKVKANDKVTLGQAIGTASTSLFDVEAGVHVHLEIKVNNSYVNPTTIFGKEMSEVASTK